VLTHHFSQFAFDCPMFAAHLLVAWSSRLLAAAA
jgi:hypothetical protein